MLYCSYLVTPGGELHTNPGLERIREALNSNTGLVWVDFIDPGEQERALLEQDLKFHYLAVEDFISPAIHPPKVDDFNDYLLLMLHGINYAVESDIIETAELRMFIGPHFVITGHHHFLYSIEAVKNHVETGTGFLKQGADFLAHAIIDALIDNVLPTVDRMAEVSAEIEDAIITNPEKSSLEAVMNLKRSTLQIHRVMAPQREIIYRMSRGEFGMIKKKSQIYYQDVYDHIVRISDLNQTTREIADNALSTYLSSLSIKQNEVMKLLAIVAAVFLPLTLLAGIYGMNFENMPELKWPWGYFAVLGIMAAAITGLVWKFWASKWITIGRKKAGNVFDLRAGHDKVKEYNPACKKQ